MSNIAHIPKFLFHRDIHSGPYKIEGYVKNLGVIPVKRKCLLIHLPTYLILDVTWSNADTGHYIFDKLKQDTYCVISFDHTDEYNLAGSYKPPLV
jgi:hypothetical protein